MTPPESDEGGEAPCFAHLLDETPALDDAQLATLVHDLADAVVIADPDGTIQLWNTAAERVFGWTALEATGQSLDLIIDRYTKRLAPNYSLTSDPYVVQNIFPAEARARAEQLSVDLAALA